MSSLKNTSNILTWSIREIVVLETQSSLSRASLSVFLSLFLFSFVFVSLARPLLPRDDDGDGVALFSLTRCKVTAEIAGWGFRLRNGTSFLAHPPVAAFTIRAYPSLFGSEKKKKGRKETCGGTCMQRGCGVQSRRSSSDRFRFCTAAAVVSTSLF